MEYSAVDKGICIDITNNDDIKNTLSACGSGTSSPPPPRYTQLERGSRTAIPISQKSKSINVDSTSGPNNHHSTSLKGDVSAGRRVTASSHSSKTHNSTENSSSAKSKHVGSADSNTSRPLLNKKLDRTTNVDTLHSNVIEINRKKADDRRERLRKLELDAQERVRLKKDEIENEKRLLD